MALGLVVSTLLFAIDTSQWYGFRGFALREGLIDIAGGAVGLAVAFRAGGWRAALGLIAFLVAMDLAGAAAAAPGRAVFCERSGGNDPVCAPRTAIDEMSARWPLVTGLVAGLPLTRALRSGGSGTNAPLEAIGTVALGQAIVFAASTLLFAPGPAGTPDTTTFWMRLWTIASVFNLAFALLGGHLLVRRGQKPWPAAVVVAALFFVSSWLPTLYDAGAAPNEAVAEYQWLRIASLANALAFVLASVVTAALAPPRPPDADAARRAAR